MWWYLGVLFQVLMAVHFFRRRPEGYWFFVILFLGPLGAAVYFVLEVVPDLRVKPPWLARMARRRRRQWLEHVAAEIPALEHLQELGEICAVEGEHARDLAFRRGQSPGRGALHPGARQGQQRRGRIHAGPSITQAGRGASHAGIRVQRERRRATLP